MEENDSSAFIQLFFKSMQVSQLQAHVCDAEEKQLTAITLFNYQQDTIGFIPNRSHYYCLLSHHANTHVVPLSLPHNPSQPFIQEIDFGSFQFRAKVYFEEKAEAPITQLDQRQYSSIAKKNLSKVQLKVMEALEKQHFFKKESASRMTKTFVRKPKAKKNLTDIFVLNKDGDIKRLVNNSTSNFGKLKNTSTPKIHEQEELFLPDPPKLTKMNTSIDEISNCFSFPDPAFHLSYSRQPRETQGPLQQQRRPSKGVQINGHRVGKRGPKKDYLVRKLQRETRSQLDEQKQALLILKSFNEGFDKSKITQSQVKLRIKKKRLDIETIYQRKGIRS